MSSAVVSLLAVAFAVRLLTAYRRRDYPSAYNFLGYASGLAGPMSEFGAGGTPVLQGPYRGMPLSEPYFGSNLRKADRQLKHEYRPESFFGQSRRSAIGKSRWPKLQ